MAEDRHQTKPRLLFRPALSETSLSKIRFSPRLAHIKTIIITTIETATQLTNPSSRMRLQSALALLFCIGAYAQQQQQAPLRSWFSKLSSYLPSALSHPKDALRSTTSDAAATIAATKITSLTLDNWRATLKNTGADGADGVEEWWVLITGGNRTCVGGQCERAERGWNDSAVAFASTTGPRQAIVNCDAQPVLCSTWAAKPPSIWHLLIPRDSHRPTEIRILAVNSSTITGAEIVRWYASKSWKERGLYEGLFHPFDGFLAKTGLNVPVGYVLSVFARVPSWTFMLLVSFISRAFL